MNILDYIKTNLKTISELTFNEIDSLILSQFCYLNFKNIIPSLEENMDGLQIKELYKMELFNQMINPTGKPELNQELLNLLSASPRFREIKLNYHINIENEETQFSATTFILNNNTIYIGIRGTDGTLVGWEEDFDLAFKSPIPSQIQSKLYIEKIIKKYPNHTIYIGGHSKGGNLAIYGAMMQKNNSQIQKIFSHDGPGFSEDITKTNEYKKIEKKIFKTIPSSSLVGMLLESTHNYKIIKSSAHSGILQHDPYSWQIENNSFIEVEQLSKDAIFMNQTINQWLSQINQEKRALFVNTLFNILESTEQDSFKDISKNWQKTIPMMIESSKNLDKETKEEMNKLLFELMKSPFKKQE